MDIPYYILGIIFALGLLFYFSFAFFNVYHMIRFGFFDFVGKMHTLLLGCIVAVILVFTIFFLKDVVWYETFTIFSIPENQLPFNF